MLVVAARPIISPRQSERLVANLWQLAIGSRLGLHIIHLGRDGEAPALAVHSPNRSLEGDAAELLASSTDSAVLSADLLPDLICSAPRVGVYHLQPVSRNFQSNSQAWGWDRADNLSHLYALLRKTPPGQIAGVALAFLPLQELQGVTVFTAYAVGPPRAEVTRHAYGLAATYAGTGVRVRRPLAQRRWLSRAMQARVSIGMAQVRRHDGGDQRMADHLAAAPAERVLGLGGPGGDQAAGVHGHDPGAHQGRKGGRADRVVHVHAHSGRFGSRAKSVQSASKN